MFPNLAEREEIAPFYQTRVLQRTLLALETVEAIPDGKQGREMTLARVLESFPEEWSEQCECFRQYDVTLDKADIR